VLHEVTGQEMDADAQAWWQWWQEYNDLYIPEDKRGQFAGYYLLFLVAIPMVFGPLVGGWLSTRFGIPTIIDGLPGFIPTPLIFQVGGVMTLLAAIPLMLIKTKKE